MNKLLANLVDSFVQALNERGILYRLEKINLSESDNVSTVSYELLGTGKSPFDRNLLELYDSDDLYNFRPEDIKAISTAATLLKNRHSYKGKVIKSFDLQAQAVTFCCMQTKALFHYKLTEIESDPSILTKLRVDGNSGYFIGRAASVLNK